MLTAFAKATNILHKLVWDEDCTCRMSTSLCELARDANYIYQKLTGFTSLCGALTPLEEPLANSFTSLCGTVNVLAEPLPALTSHCSTLTALAKFLLPFTSLSGILTASFKALQRLVKPGSAVKVQLEPHKGLRKQIELFRCSLHDQVLVKAVIYILQVQLASHKVL